MLALLASVIISGCMIMGGAYILFCYPCSVGKKIAAAALLNCGLILATL